MDQQRMFKDAGAVLTQQVKLIAQMYDNKQIDAQAYKAFVESICSKIATYRRPN